MPDKSAVSILVVDDDGFMLSLVGHMLQTLGFTGVTRCGGGHQALAHLDSSATAPGVVMIDLNMPDMDGVELVRKLVERGYAGSVILMSGEDPRVLHAVERLIGAHQLRLLGRLDKPVKIETLAGLLDKHLSARPAAARAVPSPFQPEELREGITRNELVNHYQPKVSVATGEVVGVESLVRWRHPSAGLVFPDRFIGTAEEHGLIDDLTRAVLASALMQGGAWKKAGLPLTVAVNLSMDNLRSLDFADHVFRLATDASMDPQDIVLEITESRVLRDARSALDILARLRLRRFNLSIDDFGTGQSSLAQLRDIPFNELKVDRSFVHGASTDHMVRTIFAASVTMARQLGMKIVAEGVEDLDDWKFLESSGCDVAQGYFIAKPMPAEHIVAWAEQWRTRVRNGFRGES